MNAMKAINMCRAFYDIFVENTSDFFQFFTNKGVYQNSRQRNVCLSSDSPWQIDRLMKNLYTVWAIFVLGFYTRDAIFYVSPVFKQWTESNVIFHQMKFDHHDEFHSLSDNCHIMDFECTWRVSTQYI